MDSPTATVTPEDWAVMGRAAGTTPEAFKKAYDAALEEHPPGPGDHFRLTVGPVRTVDGCEEHSFDLDLGHAIGLGITVRFCGPVSGDWKAELEGKLKAAGMTVWTTTYTLSPSNTGVCWDPHVGVAKAHLCIAIKGDRHCLNIAGEACYWALWWRCGNFDETPICFG